MIHLNILDAEAPPEISQLFVGISHLSPTEGCNYLIHEIVAQKPDTPANLDEIQKQCYRFMNLLFYKQYPFVMAPGTGYMIFCDTMFDAKIPVAQLYLAELQRRWHNCQTPEAASEHLGAMNVTVQYIHFLIEHKRFEEFIQPQLSGEALIPRSQAEFAADAEPWLGDDDEEDFWLV